ncbi:MAG: helix-turn-helix domain-containing protein [Kiritimatiellales bacterium]|nr:helix-turn-helix domain-containing protein [Kiritimatiellales bacterium]
MANVMKVLKDEISRIARSEINAALKPIKSVNASQRKYIAELRRRIEDLEKEKKQLVKTISKAVPVQEETSEETRGWISGAGVRAMRKRLKLSQKAFAELAGVSLPTVALWESAKNSGKLNIRRKEVFARLQEIKGMGIRDLAVAEEK